MQQMACVCCGRPVTNGDMQFYPDNAGLMAAQAEMMEAVLSDPKLSEIASRVASLKQDLDQRACKAQEALLASIPRFAERVPGRPVRLV